MEGIVIKSTGSWYNVYAGDGEIISCKLRGSFRIKDIKTTNPLAVGDKVDYQMVSGDDTGVITCGVEAIHCQGDGMRRYVAWANSLTDHEAMSRSRFIECPVINPTAMVRRDWMDRVGGYHWGLGVKRAMLAWESARLEAAE